MNPPPDADRGPRLENRLPAEGINSSTEHPLKEFGWLVGAGVAVLVLVIVVVGWGARVLAPHLPFEAEVALAERLSGASEQPPAHAERTKALQALADRVAARMALPAGMTVKLRYEDAAFVNAYATVGGRVHVFRGLLHELRSEDALAALLAHEIAHVKHRHVAASVGRGMAVGLLLGVLSADAGAAVAQSTLGQAAGLTLLGYSREQEAEADAEALNAVVALYAHAGGMAELFGRLGAASRDAGPPLELLRSHPLTADRLQAVQAQARARGWALEGPLTPLQTPLLPPLQSSSAAARGR